MDLSLFSLPGYAPGDDGRHLIYFAGFTGIFFVLTLFFQNGLGYTPLLAGLAVTPFAAGSAVTSAIGGRFVSRFGRSMVVGRARARAGRPRRHRRGAGHRRRLALGWWTAVPLLVAGIGSGLVISPNQTLTLANVPVQRAGTAGGVLQTGQRIGTAAGIALVGAVFYSGVASGAGLDASTALARGGRSRCRALLASALDLRGRRRREGRAPGDTGRRRPPTPRRAETSGGLAQAAWEDVVA